MFSGIIEEVGMVRYVRELDGAREICIEANAILESLNPGSSISLDGACHTVVSILDGGFIVHSIATTLSRTLSGLYIEGSKVNLERSLVIESLLDGHLVQGHVDGMGELVTVSEKGDHRLLTFRVPAEISGQTVIHGSIAINGVSLTVNDLTDDDMCEIGIIPFTWENTNINNLNLGDLVNIESDMIGKYIQKMLSGSE